MSQKTRSALQSQKSTIKNETVLKANTALRVGQMFEDINDSYLNWLDDVANNLTTETAGKVLDARQGFVLYAALQAIEKTTSLAFTLGYGLSGDKYLNFGNDGTGIRFNGLSLEFSNDGTTWIPLGQTGSAFDKGYFPDQATLEANYATATNGSWAYVGTTTVTRWVWQTGLGWVNTGQAVSFLAESVATMGSTKLITSGGVYTALQAKAASVHTHAISEIAGLQTILDAKLNSDDLDSRIFSYLIDHLKFGDNIGIIPNSETGDITFNVTTTSGGTITLGSTPENGGTKAFSTGGAYIEFAKYVGRAGWTPVTFASSIATNVAGAFISKYKIPATGNFAISGITSTSSDAALIYYKVKLVGVTSLEMTLPSSVLEDGLPITGNKILLEGSVGSEQIVCLEKDGSFWDLYRKKPGGEGTIDYEVLENKPSINSIELSGNKTGADLNLGKLDSASYNSTTGVITFTDADGTDHTIDLPIENLFQNASYNSGTQILTLTTNGGGTITVDLSTLVDIAEIVINASSNPAGSPSTGQKVYFRSDNGNYWINASGSWVGPFLGVTSTEKTTWNAKEDAANKKTNFSSPNDTDYPTTQAVKTLADTKESISIDLARAWNASLLFDKREIASATKTQTADITYTIAATGHSTTEFCYRQDVLICDGTHGIAFDFSGLPGILTFINGITSGEIPPAGTYVILFSYRAGVLMVSWPGATSESSSTSQLSTPASFTATPNGQSQIDLSWADVVGETNYLVEQSDTGTGGWTTLTSPAAGATSYSHTGLSSNTTKYYRIKAVGNGTTVLDSPFATANATTASAGDVTAPTVTFTPSNGVTDWTVNKALTISFNEAIRNIDNSQITDANVASLITLKQTNSSGSNIGFTASINAGKTLITITPTSTYGANQLVYLALAPVEDSSGNATTTQSITFTTTEYSEFNGTSNLLRAGDILDTLFAVNDTYFELELTVKDHSTAATTKWLITKNDSAANQREFYFFINGTDIFFSYFLSTTQSRQVKWTGVLGTGEQKIVLKYNGSIDTNDGLDRCVLEINDVVKGSKSLSNTAGALTGTLFNSTAQLAVGALVTAEGAATVAYTGKAKGFKVRSNSATLLNIAVLAIGTDSSGNSNNGTWV